MSKKVILVILDGFGHSTETEHNAIAQSKMTYWPELLKKYPHSLLETSGNSVGLPHGIMGNSEVGHLNLGGGRIIQQELTRIADFAKTSGFEKLEPLRKAFLDPQGNVHFLGLLSDGGVHSDQEHLFLLLESLRRAAPSKKAYIHAILDGRDTPPQSAVNYLKTLEQKLTEFPQIKLATIVGRFYAMDRDQRWERVEKAYHALIDSNSATHFSSASAAIQDAYAKGETDEFVLPRIIAPEGRITNLDQCVFFNFRADRAREISQVFGVPEFNEFATPIKIKPENWICFTSYQKAFPFPVLFKPQTHTRLLGEEVSRHGGTQLRVAETEKYAHVTYFFNGGQEKPYDKEDRVLVPSPKDVATYDQKPEMSAFQVTSEVLKGIENEYSLIVVNYANGDMVGHTGVESAAIRAVETLDECVEKITEAALLKDYDILITADHGNCEQMLDSNTNTPFTQHTTNPVPLLWASNHIKNRKIKNGILADVAPTILALFGWEQPKEMTGKNLIQ